MSEALFELVDDGLWLPTDVSRGPWSPDALHGSPVAALLAGAAEQAGTRSAPDGVTFHPSRLTVELLRPVPVTPLRVDASVIRPGRKVQLVESTISADDMVVAKATLLQIRLADVDAAPSVHAEAPPGPDAEYQPLRRLDNGHDGFHNTGVEHRFVRGAFDEPGPATDWIRLKFPVVAGAEPSALQRVCAAADFGNGVSGLGVFRELIYINPDLTIHLHRLPVGEWVCIDAVTHMTEHGVALAESALFDEAGHLGRALQSLIVDRRESP